MIVAAVTDDAQDVGAAVSAVVPCDPVTLVQQLPHSQEEIGTVLAHRHRAGPFFEWFVGCVWSEVDGQYVEACSGVRSP
jgi:hypothetical protein